ncbi:hypothetical protein MTO96_030234 [Rhipicephalus appendiculatus]
MMLHACYCHSSHLTMFRVRSDNLSQELITSSDQGIKYETSYDLSHLTFQQRCCFCPAVVTGFEDFQRHVSGKHNLVLRARARRQALHALWLHGGAELGIQVSAFRLLPLRTSLQRGVHLPKPPPVHYTYYPALCKICDQSFRGINAKEAHMRAVHGGSGLTKGEEIDVDAEVARQSVLRVHHTCQAAASRLSARRTLKCTGKVFCVGRCSARTSGEWQQVSGNATTEEEDVPAYYCMQCSVGFMYLERLLSHGFTQHGCDYFCSVCYRGFQTKEHFTRHCRSRTCWRPPSVFRVEVVKRSSQRKFFYRELFVDYDVSNGAYSSSGEDDELEECYYYFYKQDYEPVQGISRTYITAETEMKL